MNDVQEAFKEFDEVARKYSDYGSCDSEPYHVLRHAVKIHLGLKDSKNPVWMPATGEDWQLYTASMKCGKAAKALTAALKKLLKKLKKLYFNPDDRETILGYVEY